MLFAGQLFAQPVKYKVSFSGELTIEKIAASPGDTVNPPAQTGFRIGCNTFPYTPLSLYSDIGMKTVRAYCPWHWFGRPGGELYVEPMYQAWTPECSGLDDFLAKCKAKNIDPLLCFNQTPEWLRNTGNGNGGNDYPPTKAGADLLKGESYKEYADFLFQIAARYGRVKHPESALKVNQVQQYNNQPINQKRTGLALLNMIEVGNEVDHWFEGFDNEKYMDAEEHAAMLSVCYDAIKRADPDMIVVMGGITDFNPWYLKRMNEWFVKNRPDKKFAADVINVHHYSNFKNKPGTLKPDWIQDGACYPEEDGNFGAINEVVALAKSWGKIVYVTEFGADTKQPSQMYAPPRAGMTSEDVQAEIIVRTFRAYKAAGVSAAYVFTGPDGSSGSNTGQFSRSGIFTAKPEYKKKAAYEAIRKLIAE